MEFSAISSMNIIAAIFSALFFFTLFRISQKFRNQRKKPPPEACGGWPLIGHLLLLGGKEPAHLVLSKMADSYGPIFTMRLGMRRALVVSNWEIARECFTTNDVVFASRPKLLAPKLLGYDYAMIGKAMKKTARDLDQVLDKWLREHKQRRNSGDVKTEQDLMDVMLSIVENGEEFPGYDADTVTKSICLTMILAATETSTVTMIWALSLLLNNKEALKKAQQELEEQVGKERLMEESDVKNLPYLRARVKETLRLYPAAPLALPHESTEDCTVAGYHVAAGTRLIVNLQKLQRDPHVWERACEFVPERFLSTHKEFDVRGQSAPLIPFGSGRRICAGISFALQQMHLTLGNLLHGFEIETPSGEAVDMGERIAIACVKVTPLHVVLTPRLPPRVYK